MTRRSQPDAAVVTLVIAITLSTLGIYPLLRGFADFPVGTNLSLLVTISLSIGTLITSAFYAGLNRGLFLKRSNPFSDPASIIAYIAIVQAASTALFLRQRIPPSAFYLAIVILQSWSAWLMIHMAKSGLNVNHSVMNRLPWVAAITTGSFGILAWPVQNFWPLETLLAVVTVWQTATVLALLLGVWMWFSLHPKFSFRGQTAMASLANRLQRQEDTPSIWLTSVIGLLIQSVGLMVILAGPHENLPPFWPILVNTIHFYTATSLFNNWYKFSKFGVDKEHYTTLAKLASQSAKRMLRRRSNNQNAWAATVGLKTTSFTIDHDPDSQVAQSIPATLLRIRNDEIINMVNQITQRRTLALNNVGQKIIGTIDPEQSSRPCVDALNLFATLYLDAGPIIERRVAGLVSLLPLVNPGLAKIVSTNQIIPLLRKNHWFFHFEFTWVDQSLINTPSATRYGIQMDPVSLETQWALMGEMKKTHSIGNFLWIGKEAHERLLQEAPHIASIIQPHVIKDSAGSEHIIFAIKFEQLVPRLQRYYDLDDVRSRIIDYEPRQEAQRLLNLLSLQEQGAKNRVEKRRIIDSLISYNWHGFKEKDQALKLILRIYQQEQDSGLTSPEGEQTLTDSFIEVIKNAVSLIGYPSQILNQAHVYKIELRNIPKLKQHALNANSLRFEESWVLLSNMSHQSLHTENANLVRDIIDTAMKDSKIMQIQFVHAKMIDALIALGRREDASGKDLETLIQVMDLIIKQGTTDDCLALGLDGANLLSDKFKLELNFKPSTVRYFDEQCAQSKESGKSSYTSITSRWQELRAVKEQKSASTIKAS